jgi:hypothetical protein
MSAKLSANPTEHTKGPNAAPYIPCTAANLGCVTCDSVQPRYSRTYSWIFFPSSVGNALGAKSGFFRTSGLLAQVLRIKLATVVGVRASLTWACKEIG